MKKRIFKSISLSFTIVLINAFSVFSQISFSSESVKVGNIQNAQQKTIPLQTDEYQLDSIVEESEGVKSKIVHTYFQDNLTNIDRYFWDTDKNLWIKTYETEYKYKNNNITYYLSRIWDSDKKIWIGSNWKEYDYDEKDRRISYRDYIWNKSTNVWNTDASYWEFKYDEEDRTKLEEIFIWNTETELKLPYYKHEYYYSLNRELHNEFSWSNGEWKQSYKTEFIYDAIKSNAFVMKYRALWSNNEIEWRNETKEERTYNSKGLLTSNAFYNWNLNQQKWIGTFRNDISFDNNGNDTLSVNYIWDTANDSWLQRNKQVISYNAKENPVREFIYQWNTPLKRWDHRASILYEYDANDNIALKSTVFIDNPTFNFTENYFYSKKANSSVDENSQEKIQIYPNPAKNYIHIKGLTGIAKVQIFNQNGQLIFINNITENQSIPVSSFSKGIYFIRIETDSCKSMFKFIKE